MKPVKEFHKTLQDRIVAANRFIVEKKFRGELWCDTMSDEVMRQYYSWPARIFIILNGIIIFEGGKRNQFGMCSDIDSVLKFLRERKQSIYGVSTVTPVSVDTQKNSDEAECSS